MILTYDELMNRAKLNAERAEVKDFDVAPVYSQLAIAYATMAVARQLEERNEEENLNPTNIR
jgi:hypothetical protein